MKTTITTSTIKSLANPLTAMVMQHEGKDYNQMHLSVTEYDGIKILTMLSQQPTYTAMVSQPLNVAEEEGATTATIDMDAVACSDNEHYMVPNKSLNAILRNISCNNIELIVTSDGLDIFAGDAIFHLEAGLIKSGIHIPQYTLVDAEADNYSHYRLLGTFAPGSLPVLLDPAIRLSRSSGKASYLKSKAVHMVVGKDGRVSIEGMSTMGAVAVGGSKDFTLADASVADDIHIAIPLVAAERLTAMATSSGREVSIAYDADDRRIVAWCSPYVISIATEDVDGCRMPDAMDEEAGMDFTRLPFVSALAKVKATGNSTVVLTVAPTGCIEVLAPNGMFSIQMAERIQGSINHTLRLTLPLDTLLAIVRGYEDERLMLWDACDSPFVCIMSKNEEHVAVVMKM